MGWLPQSEFDRLKREAEALTPEQRLSLTWEEAQRFVAWDTIEMASWSGLKRSKLTPWQAVARLKNIDPNGQPVPLDATIRGDRP